MGIPKYLTIMIVIGGWATLIGCAILNWEYGIIEHDIVASLMAGSIGCSIYAGLVFSTLLMLGEIL